MCQRCAEVKGVPVPTGVCEEKMALGICPHMEMPESSFYAAEPQVQAAPRKIDLSVKADGGVLLTADGIPVMGD